VEAYWDVMGAFSDEEIRKLYLDSKVKKRRMRLPTNVSSVRKFYDIIYVLLQTKFVKEHWPIFNQDTFRYAAFSPSVETTTPCITYWTFQREPMGEPRPRIREQLADPNHPGQGIEVRGQRFANTVQFDCWDPSGDVAEDLAESFENMMFGFSGYLQQCGVALSRFVQQLRDETVTAWKDDITNRTLRYFIITERIIFTRVPIFRDIKVQVKRVLTTDESVAAYINEKRRLELLKLNEAINDTDSVLMNLND